VQKELRLTKREDFNKVYRFGKSNANFQFVVYSLPQSKVERFRAGISVSKKIGNAVVRNRIRRVVKEILRHHADRIRLHCDIVVIARKPVAEMDYKEMEKSLLHALKRASVFK
jgi:ribonuclease P protein component